MVLSWSRFSVLPPTSCKSSDKMLNPFASVSPHAKWEGQCLPSLLINILQSTFATCEDRASWQVPGVIHQPAMNSVQHEGWTQPWCELGTAQLVTWPVIPMEAWSHFTAEPGYWVCTSEGYLENDFVIKCIIITWQGLIQNPHTEVQAIFISFFIFRDLIY